jgi:16S rRNA (uracil1498-N3)-methyltransferase
MTRRRWIADEWSESAAVLRDAQADHLSRVLRARIGQQFDIVAGDAVRRGVIDEIGERHVRFVLGQSIEGAAALPLTVALGIIRFERMEWAIEKLTELGVARIVPLQTERTEKHLSQAAEKRVERWRKIARESAQQARRDDVPDISAPTALSDLATAESSDLRLLLSEQERARPLYDWLNTKREAILGRTIIAAIGPEGGWSDRELAIFSKHQWEAVSLGARILRAETATIAVASLVNLWMQS